MIENEPQSYSEEGRKRQLEEWKKKIGWDTLDPIQRGMEVLKFMAGIGLAREGIIKAGENLDTKDPLWEFLKSLRKGEEREVGNGGGFLGFLRKEKPETFNFGFMGNGTVGGAVGLVLAGGLLAIPYFEKKWWNYGMANFPFTPQGFRKHFNEAKGAVKQLGNI